MLSLKSSTPRPTGTLDLSMLLIPTAGLEQDEITIAFYWLNLERSEAHDAVVRLADYASQPAERAAQQILIEMIEGAGAPPAG